MQTRTLIVTGFIALEASVNLLQNKKRELEDRFPPFFMSSLEALPDLACAERALALIGKGVSPETPLFPGVIWARELGEGGLFSDLWNMAEELGAGLRVRVPAVPIRQETIEVLELFDLDPYYAPSGGAVLTVTEDPAALLAALHAAGLCSVPIGILTSSADRLLLMRSHTRYLDRPR